MTTHEFMRAVLTALHIPIAQLSREAKINRTTVSRMLNGKTLGTIAHRRALTKWGRQKGLVRGDEEWWTAINRAMLDHEVGRAVGRAVGAGLTTCHHCGMPLEYPLPSSDTSRPSAGDPADESVMCDQGAENEFLFNAWNPKEPS